MYKEDTASASGDQIGDRRWLLRGGAVALGGAAAVAVGATPASAATTVDGGTPSAVNDLITVRRGTAAAWGSGGTLAAGEPGYETDTGGVKVGDGTTGWGSLPYLMRSTPGGAVTPVANRGDLNMALGAVTGGAITEGTIRQANGISIAPPPYTQTVRPLATEHVLGRFVGVDWNALLKDDGDPAGPYSTGPIYGNGHFGPPAVFDLKGDVKYGKSLAVMNLAPIAFGTVLKVGNEPGVPITMVPGWGFMYAQLWVADAARMTLSRNDTNKGGASFVDTQGWVTANDGEIVGEGIELTGFYSGPVVFGQTHVERRIAVDVNDVNALSNPYNMSIADVEAMLDIRQPGESEDLIRLGFVPNIDRTGGGVVDEQIGIRIQHLGWAGRNIGIENASATVEVPVAKAITAAGDALPIDATVVVANNTTGADLTLTSVPTIPDGLDGQRLTIVASSAAVVVQDESALAGSNLRLHRRTRTLRAGDTLPLLFSGDLGAWIEAARPSTADRPDALWFSHDVGQIIPHNEWTTIGWPSVVADSGVRHQGLTAASTIASGSNGQTLPTATINLASASSFPSSGTVLIRTSTNKDAIVAYTGKSGNALTGCTGGSGTLVSGQGVRSANTRLVLSNRIEVLASRVLVTFAASSNGVRGVRIIWNISGSRQVVATAELPATNRPNQPVGVEAVVSTNPSDLPGSWYEVEVFQNSGGALECTKDGLQAPVWTATVLPSV